MYTVIVGGGVAGVSAAQRLRERAPAAPITILEAERHVYYRRPGLIDVLAGNKNLADITPYGRDWYRQRDIAYRTSSEAVRLDLEGRRVWLSSGEAVPFDRVLLASGAQAFCPPIPGAERADVFTIRSVEDVERIVEAAARCRTAAVVGGGWLGLEAARALVQRGLATCVVEREPWLLPTQLDRAGSEVLEAALVRQGVDVYTGVGALEILSSGELTAGLAGGTRTLPAELVVVAAGIRCRLNLAQTAGLAVGRGVVVDDFMAAAEGVFAAGDAAEWQGQVYGIIPAAREQALVAADNMLALGSSRYRGTTPLNMLKVAGVDLSVLGDAQPRGGPGRELRYSDAERGIYRKLVLDPDGRLRGAVLLGDRQGVRPVQAVLRSGMTLGGREEQFLVGVYSV